MTNENFRRELNNAIDQMSGSPSPALRDRVRSSLAGAPAATGHYWIAAVAAAVIAVLLVGVLVVANPLNRRSPSPAGPIAGSSPTPTPSAPGVSPTPTSSLPAMVCASTPPTTGASAPAETYIDRLATGTHTGYDRLTIEFTNGQPSSVEVKPQAGTTFTRSPSGQTVTLLGSNGILVIIHGTDLHTAYTGSFDIKTGYTGLVEVQRVEDFEGVVQLGLGISGPACYRSFFLSNPDRLVIDIQTS
ncbi:MAG: AMIN domain-containing protein [Chloroflexi bacterium]|nr:MAG: AMIN domain-containing protein [Chloroflexota bacterium]